MQRIAVVADEKSSVSPEYRNHSYDIPVSYLAFHHIVHPLAEEVHLLKRWEFYKQRKKLAHSLSLLLATDSAFSGAFGELITRRLSVDYLVNASNMC
jgi:hypothetical protein